jgi:rhomboid protease GluP
MGSSSPSIQPEFRNPETDFTPTPEPVQRPRPSWSYAPATYALVGINCLVFLVMAARGVSVWNPTSDQLMFWGADNAGAVLIQGEWWRIVTAMFVHVGILHLATNMWCLWNLGLLAEPLMGSAGMVAVYILTGAAGNLLSTFRNWWKFYPELMESAKKIHGLLPMDLVRNSFPAGVGASGAVFGIAGALIILLKSERLPVPPIELKRLRKSVIYFAALNLVLGLSISFGTRVIGSGLNIDNMAHVGGFTCGLLFAAPMVPRLGSARKTFVGRLRLSVGIVVGLLVLFGFYLAKLAG